MTMRGAPIVWIPLVVSVGSGVSDFAVIKIARLNTRLVAEPAGVACTPVDSAVLLEVAEQVFGTDLKGLRRLGDVQASICIGDPVQGPGLGRQFSDSRLQRDHLLGIPREEAAH